MTIDFIRDEILRFTSNSDAEVLVISGKWGVGKTHAWNHFLKEAKGAGKIAPAHYAYVSLFGLTSLDDLKAAIFQNTVARDQAGSPADMESLKGKVKSTASLWRKGSIFARHLPQFEDYYAALEKVGFFSVRNQLICIDDLERKSLSLDMRDILGLVSFLKEQRTCKIVILLNDEKLLGHDDDEFKAQLEKIADVALKFEPTPGEAAAIGVDPNESFSEMLRGNCVDLGIVNIRTIKKLEKTAKRLEEELTPYHPGVLKQAIHSSSLFAFSKHQPDVAPTSDFIRSRNRYENMLVEDGQALPHPEWRALMDGYGFVDVDEFDEVILRGVENGHFDIGALHREAVKVDQRLKLADEDAQFSAAWELFHGSFDDNAQEIMDRLVEAVRSTPRVITPTNFSGTITLLKDLGWDGNIDELIEGYLAARVEDRSFWDLEDSTFGENVRDPDVRQAFERKLLTFQDERDASATLIRIGSTNSWHSDDFRFLATKEAADFRDIFKILRDKDLRRAIRGGLKAREIGNASDDMRKVLASVEAALRDIGSESAINRRRVILKGVDVPDGGEAA